MRAWYTLPNDFFHSISFRASKVDTSLFIFYVDIDTCYLLVYVDDILLTGSNSTMLKHLIQLLSLEFKLHDLGIIHYFLGIEVQSTGMGLMLRHHKYTSDILTRAGMISCKPVDTPIFTSKAIILPNTLFLILHAFVKLWVLFNISPLRDQTFALLLTWSVSLWFALPLGYNNV